MTSPLPSLPHGTRSRGTLPFAGALAFAAILAWASFPAAWAGDTPASGATAAAPSRWTSGAVDLARRCPVQDGGRVKPLDTFARYTLLALNHKRTCKDGPGKDAETLSSMEWLLDVLFRPERARHYPCFSLDTYEVLDAISVAHEGRKKRDRYSYADLFPEEASPARMRLEERASELDAKLRRTGMTEKDLGAVETGILDLSHDVTRFERLSHLADFARKAIAIAPGSKLSTLFQGRTSVPAMEVLARAEEVAKLAEPVDPHAPVTPDDADAKALEDLREQILALTEAAQYLSLVPPAGPRQEQPQWFSLAHVMSARLRGQQLLPEYERVLSSFAGMAGTASDPKAFEREVRAFQETTSSLAKGRDEYDKIGLEVALYRLDPFGRAVWIYLFAFLVLAVSWLWPMRALTWAGWGLLLGAVGLQVAGIVMRCVLRSRPPISTLYETALFISALGAISCLIVEAISRRAIALSLAPIVGGLTLFIANRFEVLKGEDTMPELIAVLDTNFWLATHVVAINIGYMGGLVAALFAHVHVLGRAFGIRRGDEEFYRSVTRMTYGLLCFALLFCVVGTILGGIWANDSWGRFWGWDPKENGALLICLSQLAILHARMGGILKPFGIAMATIFQGCVVAFSWWGVNLLGIGLHSYGFTGGIMTGLMAFYGVEAAVMGLGFTAHLLGRSSGKPLPA